MTQLVSHQWHPRNETSFEFFRINLFVLIFCMYRYIYIYIICLIVQGSFIGHDMYRFGTQWFPNSFFQSWVPSASAMADSCAHQQFEMFQHQELECITAKDWYNKPQCMNIYVCSLSKCTWNHNILFARHLPYIDRSRYRSRYR